MSDINTQNLPGEKLVETSQSKEEIEKEQEKIFLREWLYVGREEEVPNPGDFITLTVARQPIIICRDQSGNLQVLLNVCRHRGTRVADGCGNTSVFSCPYHAWTYELTGGLRRAPGSVESDNLSCDQINLRKIRS